MEFDSFIGVDVSKNTLDLCVLGKEAEMRLYKIANRQRSLEDLFNELQEALDLTTTLICAEYTGHYSNVLRDFCLSRGWSLWLENGAEIKFRSGVQRGKDDAMDAHRIARYAHRFQDKAKLLKVTSESLQELQLLICERELYIKEQAKYNKEMKEQMEKKGEMGPIVMPQQPKQGNEIPLTADPETSQNNYSLIVPAN